MVEDANGDYKECKSSDEDGNNSMFDTATVADLEILENN